MLFTTKCLSCANANQMCCNICGVGRNGEREKYKPKPPTNADRIRSMTDEELADEVLRWFNWLNAVDWDDNRIINWLKQEVKE